MAKKKEEKKVEMTRAQKTEATKGIVKELLAVNPMKHNELIEETAKLYTARYKSEETENVNDVKGRVGSVLDIMKKESEVMYEGGMYALKSRVPVPAPVEAATEEPKKKPAKTKKTAVKTEEKAEEVKTEEKPAPKKKAKAKKLEEKPVKAETEKTETPAEAETVKKEDAPTPKKRGRKVKAAAEVLPQNNNEEGGTDGKTQVSTVVEAQLPAQEKDVEEKKEEMAKPAPVKAEVKTDIPAQTAQEEPKKEENALTVKQKAEVAQKGVVMDMSFLIGGVKNKPATAEEKAQKAETSKPQPTEEKKAPMSEIKEEKTAQSQAKKEEKTQVQPTQTKEVKVEQKPAQKQPQKGEVKPVQKQKQLSSDEKLCEAFLKRMRSLGGDYFEYYSVYLLERYSMKNGRRLEGMRISGGDHDGGIDGEIELTDKFGFKETIYIQSKNWDPGKGKEEYWVVGETLVQQFIGACACKQAKDGKQHCRGVFVTTSRFTPDAKHIFEDMSDRFVGYDGNDLYEAAKECEFGVIKKNGEWTLDEKLLSGTKAFFNMF